jgi:RNA polymerase sigma factor (sigma-70 family)
MADNRSQVLTGVLTRVLQHARAKDHTDGELLSEFLDRRDPLAFAELVERHGPMVLGVCRRVLRHTQDAEDAFQATFMVLARKAGAVSPRNVVRNWLYGVAFQTAVRARAVIRKRKARESIGVSIPEPSSPEAVWDDVAVVLDEELGRLPEHYRAVIVLCDVEERTRAAAAVHLSCPEGSVSSRLSRARTMLARRLAKRGLTLSVGAGPNGADGSLEDDFNGMSVESFIQMLLHRLEVSPIPARGDIRNRPGRPRRPAPPALALRAGARAGHPTGSSEHQPIRPRKSQRS